MKAGKAKKALLIVDVQNDFLPGGALGVPGGDKIIPALNRYIKIFSKKKLPIFVTADWHPVRTKHFKSFGGLWPVHCIQNTFGAAFHQDLKLPKESIFLYKGLDPEKDSYSAFQAEDESGCELLKWLKRLDVKEIFIGGLATDYCIKFSSIDAIKLGFKVKILVDAIKGVDLKPLDSKQALERIIKLGCKKITLKQMKG